MGTAATCSEVVVFSIRNSPCPAHARSRARRVRARRAAALVAWALAWCAHRPVAVVIFPVAPQPAECNQPAADERRDEEEEARMAQEELLIRGAPS
jgi:hypothetical protein